MADFSQFSKCPMHPEGPISVNTGATVTWINPRGEYVRIHEESDDEFLGKCGIAPLQISARDGG